MNILFGVFSLLLSSFLFLMYDGPLGMYQATDDNIIGLLVAASAVAHFLLAVPCIVGGVFLRKLAEWSRGLVIVTSALNILNVPLGSVLGGYGLWVLLTPETDPLFAVNPLNRVINKSVAQTQPVPGKTSTSESTIIPSPRS